MKTYWLSFRIHEDSGYDERYESLTTTVRQMADETCWWFETTSFYIFRSELGISDIADYIRGAIAPSKDLVVVGMPEFKSGRVIGKCDDQDIFKLVPFMKKV